MIYYSQKTGGFYTEEIHGDNIPDDAVEISESQHAALVEGQAQGKIIVPDENGRPILQDPPPYVPQSVTRRQGQRALLDVGMLDDVEAAIEAIEDPIQRRAAQIEYEAATWERGNAFLQALWAQLGGTEQQLDDLFILAASK